MGLLDSVPELAAPTYTPPSYTPQQATATPSTAVSYEPKPFNVAPNQTIQGQLPGIIDTNSALMRQAETRAKQAANAKGLLNSSMAVGAGHEAVIGAALPIAQNDAGVFERAGTNTVNAQNAALNFGAAATNQSSLANAQLGTNVSLANTEAQNKTLSERYQTQQQGALANLDAATRSYTANLDAQTRITLGQLDATTKTNLANLDGQYRQLLQTNQGAASLMQQALTNIANISNNNQLSEDAKREAIASQVNTLHNSLNTLSATASTAPSGLGDLNIGSLWEGYTVDDSPSYGGSAGGGAESLPTAPGSTVQAFGQSMTIGPSVAPNTNLDTARYNEARTNRYPYWLASDGYVYPMDVAPGAWPESSFTPGTPGGTTGGTTGTPTTTPPAPVTGGSNPLALGFTQVNGQFQKEALFEGNVSFGGYLSPVTMPITEVFGKGFVGQGGLYYNSAQAAATSIATHGWTGQ